MELQANPDPESLKLIVWLLLAVLAILVSAVGFFVTFGVGWVKDSIKQLSESFGKMADAITGLQVTVAEVKTQFDAENPVVVKRLNAHADMLDDHAHRITILETEHKRNHLQIIKKT